MYTSKVSLSLLPFLLSLFFFIQLDKLDAFVFTHLKIIKLVQTARCLLTLWQSVSYD